MIAFVLVASGVFLAAHATWRGYAAARAAMQPLAHPGDPTRTLIDATRPVHARGRVRLAARQVAVSVGWLAVALYGLFLATVGSGMPQ